MLYIENEESEATEYETDREKFLGRGNALLQASAWKKPLSKTTGAPLDPIFSLRRTIKVKPLESKTITAITGITATKEEALELLEKFNNRREIDRTIDLAQIHGQIELRHLNVATQDATLFQRLGSLVMYPDPFLQANLATKKQNTKSQSGLFPYGISGDYPIMLVKISLKEGLSVIRQMLAAHEYLRMKNVKVDLVIVSEESVTYANPLFNQVQSVIETSLSHPWMDKPGGIYLRAGYLISEEDKTLLQSTAQIIIDADWGSLSDHLDLSGRNIVSHRNSSKIVQDMNKVYGKKDIKEKKYATKDLAFFNGIGGFDTKAKEYQIIVDAKNIAPAPWSNIISNGKFGTTISDTGLESTWMGNSQSNRLTPWSNDPLGQSTGEAIYVNNMITSAFFEGISC
jgi:cellobiose phosphorylase